MNLSTQQKQLLDAAAELQQERQTIRAELHKIREDNRRRKQIADKFRSDLFRKGLAAAGINYDDIQKRHASDTQSMIDQIPSVQRYLSANSKYQDKLKHQLVSASQRRPEHKSGGQPPLSVFLNEAAQTVIQSFVGDPPPANAHFSMIPYETSLFARWEGKDLSVSTSWDIGFNFFWTLPRGGLLTVNGVDVFVEGYLNYILAANCHNYGDVSVSIYASILLQQFQVANAHPPAPVQQIQPWKLLASAKHGGGDECSGTSGFDALSSATTLNTISTPFSVVPPTDNPLSESVLVEVRLWIEADLHVKEGGYVDLNLGDPTYSIWIPGVLLTLD